jgi:hypothetical protein
MSFTSDIVPILTDVMEMLQGELRKEIAAQGHVLTGRLSDSIEFEIDESAGQATGKMYAEEYGGILEVGVKAERIPYSGRTGKGGTSLYIQGLINFWELRGLSGREAVGAAFATATVQKREGMPTRGSYQHSSTGERTGFIRTVIERNTDDIAKIIEERYGATLALNFVESFSGYENIRFSN